MRMCLSQVNAIVFSPPHANFAPLGFRKRQAVSAAFHICRGINSLFLLGVKAALCWGPGVLPSPSGHNVLLKELPEKAVGNA